MTGGTGWITTPNGGTAGDTGGKTAPAFNGTGNMLDPAGWIPVFPTVCGAATGGLKGTDGLKISPNIGTDCGINPALGMPTAGVSPAKGGGTSGVCGLPKIIGWKPTQILA